MSEPISWTPARVKLGDLKPWAHNPRQSTKKQAQRILASFNEFGQVQTVAIGPDNEVYDGHQRLSALLTIHGKDYEVDARRASRALTDDERKRLVLMLHAGATGEWDWDALSSFDTALLQDGGMDKDLLAQMNRDSAALIALLAQDESGSGVEDVEPQVDKAEELREKWGVQSGQLWQLGEHRLLCGDSTKSEDVARVMGGEKADAVVTDPPYGMNLDTNYPTTEAVKGKKYARVIGDDVDFDPSWMFATFSGAQFYLFGADYYCWHLPRGGSWLVWDKKMESLDASLGSGFELVWVYPPKKRDVLRFLWNGFTAKEKNEARTHPTQKPIDLIKRLGEATKGLIVDPYSGSGTTIMACEQLGRQCRAVEIDAGYVAVALERWSTATGKTPTLIDKLDTHKNE